MFIKRLLRYQYFLPLLVFFITIIPRLINLFGYPYLENDEGVYTSQAWWMVNFGKLAPYTYWYDHAPFGWLTIGIWQKLTGGPLTFGLSLYSTRIFMTLVAGLTNLLIYQLIVFLTKNKKIAFLSCLIYSLSALGITYQRRVLLDNLETFWLMLSLWYFFKAKSRLNFIWLSAVFFGLSFLSKESVLFFLPIMLYGIWLGVSKENRRFALMIWLVTSLFLILLFPLLAFLKKEFFPSSWFGSQPHVSFLETVFYQMGRGTEFKPWQSESSFFINVVSWFKKDFLLLAFGVWSIVVNTLLNWKDKNNRIIILLSLFFVLFLTRGGLVLQFYILPLLPLLSINIALALSLGEKRFKKQVDWLLALPRFSLVVFLLGIAFISEDIAIYTAQPAKKQVEAVAFVKNNLKAADFVVIDDFCFSDLRLAKGENKAFNNAEWFWKVEQDKEIREDKLANDWRKIDYILLSGEMRRKLLSGELPFLSQAFNNAVLIKDFPSDDPYEQGEVINLEREGDGWQALFKVEKEAGFEKIISQ